MNVLARDPQLHRRRPRPGGIIHPPDTLRLALRTDNLAAKVQGSSTTTRRCLQASTNLSNKNRGDQPRDQRGLFALSQQLNNCSWMTAIQGCRTAHAAQLGSAESAQANRAGGPPATREACALTCQHGKGNFMTQQTQRADFESLLNEHFRAGYQCLLIPTCEESRAEAAIGRGLSTPDGCNHLGPR